MKVTINSDEILRDLKTVKLIKALNFQRYTFVLFYQNLLTRVLSDPVIL